MEQKEARIVPISTLPEDKLPSCWKDEERINVLFAPFRNRTINPKDYETKLEFWSNVLSIYCDYNNIYTFKLSDLMLAFKRDGRSPSCLKSVIEELLKTNKIQVLHQFLQKQSETWTGWATDILIKRPVAWGFQKLKDSLISDEKDDIYVHLPTVEKHSNDLLNLLLENNNYRIIDFNEILKKVNKDESNLNILLHVLIKNGKASSKELKTGDGKNGLMLIKFGDVKKVGTITDLEVDIYMLQESEFTLTKNMQKLEEEISSMVTEIKGYLIKGHKQTAKSCLRKKHDMTKRVSKMADALFNVQTLLSKVQDATMNAQVLDTYKAALSSLRTTFKENGLTEDNVTSTMIEIGEVLDIHDDIQQAISQPINDSDGDLEQELAELLASDTNEDSGSNGPKIKLPSNIDLENSFKNLDIKLPNVPKSPVASPEKYNFALP